MHKPKNKKELLELMNEFFHTTLKKYELEDTLEDVESTTALSNFTFENMYIYDNLHIDNNDNIRAFGARIKCSFGEVNPINKTLTFVHEKSRNNLIWTLGGYIDAHPEYYDNVSNFDTPSTVVTKRILRTLNNSPALIKILDDCISHQIEIALLNFANKYKPIVKENIKIKALLSDFSSHIEVFYTDKDTEELLLEDKFENVQLFEATDYTWSFDSSKTTTKEGN